MDKARLKFARESVQFCCSRAEVIIGYDVHIGRGAVIGEDGFGYEVDGNGIPVKIYHAGGVVIKDNASIGCNSVISRATLPDKFTVIDSYCKIDDLVHIAHNCIIGPRTMIASGCVVGGSCIVGSDCWIGSGSIIRNKIHIADHTLLGVGSVLVTDITERGQVWVGNPARFLRMRDV